jgi:glycosyltransferase involved in cell wall biosynthesis
MRLAWFSPIPPVPSGIATCSAELVGQLEGRHLIDVYIDAAGATGPGPRSRGRSAHEFVWQHRVKPYDLTVYQVGNSSHHDYMWPYLFRYPGLTVLHDAHLHHARAAALLRTMRSADYRDEFVANHPEADPDLAELAIAGFDNHLYYSWPMTRLVVQASRLTAVHGDLTARALRADLPDAAITTVRLAHGSAVTEHHARALRARLTGKYAIRPDAVVFGVFGGLTPEKRIPQVLDALASILPHTPSAHLLLAGAPASHYDVHGDVRHRSLDEHVTITGYLETDEALTEHIAACDVSLNLRWPTAREMSGPWLRALAAGRPTVITDLAHLADVPSLDPRTWRLLAGAAVPDSAARIAIFGPGLPGPEPQPPSSEAVCVSIDILDEDHSLRLAMRRLASDPALRSTLGEAGRRYWEREHSMPRMLADYDRVLADAVARPAPRVELPDHLVNNGDRLLNRILGEFSVARAWE